MIENGLTRVVPRGKARRALVHDRCLSLHGEHTLLCYVRVGVDPANECLHRLGRAEIIRERMLAIGCSVSAKQAIV